LFSKKRHKQKPINVTRNAEINQQALVVGVNDYKGTAYDLDGIEIDIQKMSKLFSSWGFKVKTVRNKESMNIQRILSDYAAKLKEDDVFILYFSGHGSSTVDRSGDELNDDRDELIVVSDGTKNLFILDDKLDNILEKIRARKLIIFDSCNSGTANRSYTANQEKKIKYIPAPANVGDKEDDLTIPIQSFMPVQKGPYIFFASCRDNEKSFSSKKGSLYTKNLLSNINLNKNPSQIHKQTVDNLKKYFHPNLTASDENLKFNTLKSYLKVN
jgi:hypothetical protein